MDAIRSQCYVQVGTHFMSYSVLCPYWAALWCRLVLYHLVLLYVDSVFP